MDVIPLNALLIAMQELKFVVGDNSENNGFSNPPLDPEKDYKIYVRAESSVNGKTKVSCVLAAIKCKHSNYCEEPKIHPGVVLICFFSLLTLETLNCKRWWRKFVNSAKMFLSFEARTLPTTPPARDSTPGVSLQGNTKDGGNASAPNLNFVWVQRWCWEVQKTRLWYFWNA